MSLPPGHRRRRVAIESPYKADTPEGIEANVVFARQIMRYATQLGGSPYAMHLLLTQCLDDTVAEERSLGIECGLTWTDAADEVWYCLRPGMTPSPGMQLAIDRNQALIDLGCNRRIRQLRFTQEGHCLTPEALADFEPFVADPQALALAEAMERRRQQREGVAAPVEVSSVRRSGGVGRR